MRTKEEVLNIINCYNEGVSASEASKKLKIPRETIRDYYKKIKNNFFEKIKTKSLSKIVVGPRPDFLLENKEKCYSYILGLYLGDGHITEFKNKPGCFRIRIFQFSEYTSLIKESIDCFKQIFPDNKIGIYKSKTSKLCIIYTYSRHLHSLFPQHGVGKKHERSVVLTGWQKEIVEKYPKEYIKGLIDSDGCRVKGHYVRYEFTNCSVDIVESLLWVSDLLKLEPTKRIKTPSWKSKTTSYVVSFAKRKDVENLEGFIGIKK